MASSPKEGQGLKRSSIELHPIPGDEYRGGSAAGAIRRSIEIQQGVRRSGSMEGQRRTSTEMKRDKMGLGKTDNLAVRRSIDVIVSVKESSARASMALERKTAADKAAGVKGGKLDTVTESKGKTAETDGAKEAEKVDMDEHKVPWEELCKRFGSDLNTGLTDVQAAINLEKYGKNALTPPKTTPQWVKYLLQMATPFAIIMWIAAVLCFIGYGLDQESIDSLVLAIALIFVIFATGTFAWYQEKQSGKIMDNFTKLLPTMARVIRDGTKRDIDAVSLVPGDIVEIISGNKIPADIRIIEQATFKVDNSSLTGESEPCTRSKDCTDDNPFETKNLAFFSTLAVDGTAKGMVIFTGDHTLIGRIANLASTTVKRKSPIAVEIHHFVLVIGAIALTLGIVFFGVGFKVYGTSDIIKNIVLAIGIIVANVPEGLPATVTMCLTHAAHVMASKNVLVKSLEAVETLGSTSAICSDKTGTLTQNRMTLMQLFYNLDFYSAAHDGGPKSYNKADPVFQWFQKVMTLGSKAQFAPGQEDVPVLQRQAFGDATETGMIKFCELVEPIEKMRLEYPKIMELAFNSKNKFALSIHEDTQADHRFLCMKGAPERIIERCNRMMILENGAAKEIPLDEALKDKLNEANEDLGSRGMRVLGVCMSILDTKVYTRDYVFDVEAENYPTNNLCFLGLAALIDPPKETVPMAVHKCQTAGITVIMVTGDHPITAKAIAKEVGIIHGETIEDVAKRMKCSPKEVAEKYPEEAKKVTAVVVAGTQIKDFTDADWDRVLGHPEVVFARTTPEQKLIIVEQNQNRNRIVAVTGDGVNDSPALKKADIGVAMGISGSDVSKEAAKMVLLDDNFASIVSGVEEGRLIFDNLKKSIAYTLEHLGPEVIPYLISFILETPIPLTTILILCIDLGTDIAPAISFAYEVPESDIMDRPPRNPKVDKLAGWRLFLYSYAIVGLFETAATLFTYFIVFNTEGIPSSYLLGTAKDWEDDQYLRGCCTPKNADGTLNSSISFEAGCCTTCQIPSNYINLDYDKRCDAPVMWLWDQAENLPFRDEIWRKVNTAVWFSIVVGQWGGIVVCKTRKLSVFQQGMLNWPMNGTLIFEVALSFFIIMTPGVQDILGTTDIQAVYWFTAAPFAFAIVMFDEIRKWAIRRWPGCWVEFLTYY